MSSSISNSEPGMSPKGYFAGLLGVLVLLLGAAAGMVFTVDPLQLFRKASLYEPVIIFDERTQNAGLIRNYPSDSLIIGSSISQVCRADDFAGALGGTFLRVSSAGLTAKELAFYLDHRFRRDKPARVYDIQYWYTFARENALGFREEYGEFPEHLYRFAAGDAARYLINYDNIDLSISVIAEALGLRRLDRIPFEQRNSSEIDPSRKKGRASVMKLYGQIVKGGRPNAAFIRNERARMVTGLRDLYEPTIAANPDVEFDIVIPPFSIAYYQAFGASAIYRLNTIMLFRDMLADLKDRHENVRLHDFATDASVIFDYDLYFDTHHYGEKVCKRMAETIASAPEGVNSEDVRRNTRVLRDLIRTSPAP